MKNLKDITLQLFKVFTIMLYLWLLKLFTIWVLPHIGIPTITPRILRSCLYGFPMIRVYSFKGKHKWIPIPAPFGQAVCYRLFLGCGGLDLSRSPYATAEMLLSKPSFTTNNQQGNTKPCISHGRNPHFPFPCPAAFPFDFPVSRKHSPFRGTYGFQFMSTIV